MSKEIIIIGGGISGLSAAWYLEKAGCQSIILLEASERLGGKIQTLHEDGFVIESAADSFITQKPEALALVKEIGMEKELIAPQATGFYFLRKGRLLPSPQGLKSMTISNEALFSKDTFFSDEAKKRIRMERFIPPLSSAEDESLAAFVERRLGKDMLQLYATPLFSGIYGTLAEELSMKSNFPDYKRLEQKYGSLSAAWTHEKKEKTDADLPPFRSLKKGMQSLCDGIAAALRHTDIRLNSAVKKIDFLPHQKRYQIITHNHKLSAKNVIAALLPAQLAIIINQDDIRNNLRQFTYSSSRIITLAYNKKDIFQEMKGTGFLVPPTEKFPLSAVTCSSEKWPFRAPEGYSLIRCFLRNDKESTDESAQRAISALLQIKKPPIKIWTSRYHHTLPQYKVGHIEKVKALNKMIEKCLPGFQVIGAAYGGVGIPDCIRQGMLAAEAFLA